MSTPEELLGLVVTVHKGQPVYLRDVAVVSDGFKEESSRSRINGVQAVNIVVKKRSGENIIAIAEAVNDILSKRQAGWPKGTRITKVLDKSRDIENMVADLNNNILTGLILVVGVLFFTMGFRNAVIVAMAIPFSMLITYTILLAMGITMNMVVLFSLILALGMLVDNAIVIVENIFRFMEQGVGRAEAAMKATSEVAMPVIGSTLTTVVAFAPMMWWPGIMGEFMKYLPLTLIIVLTASLFVALVINPALAALFMKSSKKARRAAAKGKADVAWEKPIEIKGAVLRTYAAVLRFALRHPLALIAGTVLLIVMMFQGWLLAVGLRKSVEFFPTADPRGIYINVDFPEGADMDYIDGILRKIETAVAGGRRGASRIAPTVDYAQALAPKEHRKEDGRIFSGPSDLKNVSIIYTRAVSTSTGSSEFEQNTPSHVGVRFVDLADRFESSSKTVDEIRQRVAEIAGAKITVALEADGPPTGTAVNIEIAGENFAVLGTLSKEIKKALGQLPHVEDIRDNLVEGTPSVRVRIDRQKAALFGLSTGSIGFALKAAYNGLAVSSFRDGSDDYDITVQLPDKDRQVTDVLRQLMITVPGGSSVPLSTLATVDITGSMGSITRINNQRVVTVKANVDEDKIPAAVVRTQAEEMLAKMPLPPGYKVAFTGENQDQQESEAFLSKAFIIALLLIFLVIVAQFNSVSQPFLIMTSVILATGGAFSGLMIYKMPFGIIMTGIGVISLAGVAVNNAIVLIDYTNQLRARGFSIKDAVIFAGATRLRPVFLTAITTILGLVPMVTGVSYDFTKMSMSWVSESSQFWQSMAVVVSSGLLIATFLTLVVVPTLYFLLERSKEGIAEAGKWAEREKVRAYRVLAGE